MRSSIASLSPGDEQVDPGRPGPSSRASGTGEVCHRRRAERGVGHAETGACAAPSGGRRRQRPDQGLRGPGRWWLRSRDRPFISYRAYNGIETLTGRGRAGGPVAVGVRAVPVVRRAGRGGSPGDEVRRRPGRGGARAGAQRDTVGMLGCVGRAGPGGLAAREGRGGEDCERHRKVLWPRQSGRGRPTHSRFGCARTSHFRLPELARTRSQQALSALPPSPTNGTGLVTESSPSVEPRIKT